MQSLRELARRPGIDLTLYHGAVPGLPNVPADGFRAEYVPMRYFHVNNRFQFMWHRPQMELADPAKADVLILSWNLRYATLVPALRKALTMSVNV